MNPREAGSVPTRIFAELLFEHAGRIEPERDSADQVAEHQPQARYKKAASATLHAYGTGPFCRFRVARGRHAAGLYVLTVDGAPAYAGECADLERRYGPTGYGGISPRNCFHGGQPTNCRVNAAILIAAQGGQVIDLWFCPIASSRDARRAAERRLIQALSPPWNRTLTPNKS